METNNKIIDFWTIPHFLVGSILGFNIPKREIGYSLIIGYEIVENLIIRKLAGDFFKEYEGFVNVVSDIIVGIGAYELSKKYGKREIGR